MNMQFSLMQCVSFLLSEKLPQGHNTAMFKYDIFDFLYVHQVIISLARTGIVFQNSLNIFKLLIIIVYNIFKFHAFISRFALFDKIKACVYYFLSNFYFFEERKPFKNYKKSLFHLKCPFCSWDFLDFV